MFLALRPPSPITSHLKPDRKNSTTLTSTAQRSLISHRHDTYCLHHTHLQETQSKYHLTTTSACPHLKQPRLLVHSLYSPPCHASCSSKSSAMPAPIIKRIKDGIPSCHRPDYLTYLPFSYHKAGYKDALPCGGGLPRIRARRTQRTYWYSEDIGVF